MNVPTFKFPLKQVFNHYFIDFQDTQDAQHARNDQNTQNLKGPQGIVNAFNDKHSNYDTIFRKTEKYLKNLKDFMDVKDFNEVDNSFQIQREMVQTNFYKDNTFKVPFENLNENDFYFTEGDAKNSLSQQPKRKKINRNYSINKYKGKKEKEKVKVKVNYLKIYTLSNEMDDKENQVRNSLHHNDNQNENSNSKFNSTKGMIQKGKALSDFMIDKVKQQKFSNKIMKDDSKIENDSLLTYKNIKGVIDERNNDFLNNSSKMNDSLNSSYFKKGVENSKIFKEDHCKAKVKTFAKRHHFKGRRKEFKESNNDSVNKTSNQMLLNDSQITINSLSKSDDDFELLINLPKIPKSLFSNKNFFKENMHKRNQTMLSKNEVLLISSNKIQKSISPNTVTLINIINYQTEKAIKGCNLPKTN